MDYPPLAVYGGPPAVTMPYRERWRQIELRDLARIIRFGQRDISTLFGIRSPVGKFEQAFARMCGCRYGLAMNSGTATLHSAYFACGIRAGDEVIVPSYTFFASVAPILTLGGKPVFCEIDPATLTADPEDVERRITRRTRAICVVHTWGNPARMDAFREIADRHKLWLIEDCSHAHGATYQGKPVGGWGDIGCFSLQGQKPISGGEAGIAVTDNPVLFDHMLALGHYGRTATEQKAQTHNIGNLSFGIKYRPHLYAIVLAQGGLRRLKQLNELRNRNYQILADELEHCESVNVIDAHADSVRGGLLEFIIRIDRRRLGDWPRGAFAQAAAAEGVPIVCDRYGPLHHEPMFRSPPEILGGNDIESGRRTDDDESAASNAQPDLPVTDAICGELLTLPPFTNVDPKYVAQCAVALKKVAHWSTRIGDYRTGSMS